MIAGKNGEACILLYGNIGGYSDEIRSGDIVGELLEMEAQYPRIDLRINSMGGEVYAGIAIFNAIRQSRAEITVYIDGIAAGMASVIASARRPVYMSRFARIMIHSVRGSAYGNREELQRTIGELASLEDTLSDIYAQRTGRTKEEIKSLFFDGTDHWLTAGEALRMNLIDGIYDAAPVPEDSTPAEIYAICQNRLNPTGNMFTDLLRKKPSFANLAGEEDMLAHIGELETEAARAAALQGQVADLTSRLSAFEEAAAQARLGEITALVDAAVRDGRIREPQRAAYTALLGKDFENGREALGALQPARRITGDLDVPPQEGASPWENRMAEIKNSLK